MYLLWIDPHFKALADTPDAEKPQAIQKQMMQYGVKNGLEKFELPLKVSAAKRRLLKQAEKVSPRIEGAPDHRRGVDARDGAGDGGFQDQAQPGGGQVQESNRSVVRLRGFLCG